jgi:diketogulonate reductase-like aldo/keto reductase
MTSTLQTRVPDVDARGASIPALGLGTWELRGSTARHMVERALELGYRHIDTARMYENEDEVGRAIERSGVSRDDIFLTTKIWPDDYGRDDFKRAVEQSLELLRTEQVDLLLLHWPNPEVPLEETIEALNEARSGGWTRHVGVANFPTDWLERADGLSDAPLVANQVEYHPFLDQGPVLDAVRERGMALTAYSPLGHGELVGDETLRSIGAPYGKSAVQVALRWLVQQNGVSAIPRTSDPDHLKQNLDVFYFELTDEEMRRISDLARPDARVIDPDGLAPDWD